MTKATSDVLLVDRWSAAELREKFAVEEATATAPIVEVDVVLGEASLLDTLSPLKGDGFDFAIASHVIEHVPDMITFLSDLAALLKPGGRLLLVVPDKRYTFDLLRDLSRTADLIEAWVEHRQRPSPGQIFDYTLLAAAVDVTSAWASAIDPGTLVRYCEPQYALDRCRQSAADGSYVDSHCWVFTPARFLAICADLAGLGLTRMEMRPLRRYPVRRAGFRPRPGEDGRTRRRRHGGRVSPLWRAAGRPLHPFRKRRRPTPCSAGSMPCSPRARGA